MIDYEAYNCMIHSAKFEIEIYKNNSGWLFAGPAYVSVDRLLILWAFHGAYA